MGPALQFIIVLTIGSIMVIDGLSVSAGSILDSAKQVANSANVHQISIALELYYLDHNIYPNAIDGTELINVLTSGNYIKSQPLDPAVFAYQPVAGGNDYKLSLK